MKCKKCGAELEKAAKFCPWCGHKLDIELDENSKEEIPQPSNSFANKISEESLRGKQEAESSEVVKLGEKIKRVGQNLKEMLEDDDKVTELTDDEYRNGLARQAKILNIGYTISGFICIKSAWDYRELYGWKWGDFRTFYQFNNSINPNMDIRCGEIFWRRKGKEV